MSPAVLCTWVQAVRDLVAGGFSKEVGKACGWDGSVPEKAACVRASRPVSPCGWVWGPRPGPCGQSGGDPIVLTVPGRPQRAGDAVPSTPCAEAHAGSAETGRGHKNFPSR